MNCNTELIYKTLKAELENSLALSVDENVGETLREKYLLEAITLSSVIKLFEKEDFLKDMAAIYKVQ